LAVADSSSTSRPSIGTFQVGARWAEAALATSRPSTSNVREPAAIASAKKRARSASESNRTARLETTCSARPHTAPAAGSASLRSWMTNERSNGYWRAAASGSAGRPFVSLCDDMVGSSCESRRRLGSVR
jgi:hypothetical protein